MPNQPLLVLSGERRQREVQRALGMAAATHHELVRNRWPIAASLLEFAGGLTLVGYLGPVWTWILANWRGGE